MYSVILMAAMTGPAEAPAWGHLFNRCDCSGYSCGGCTGCTGYTCNGCGGGCCGGYGYTGSRWGGYPVYAGSTCSGCCGGFLGWRNGCWGTGGYRVYGACHGAGACFGYAYAGVGYGFAGCYGSCYGSYTNYFSYWAQPANVHYGYGMPIPTGPAAAPAGPLPMDKGPAPVKPINPVPGKTDAKLDAPAPAKVLVSLPADAVLFANGVRTTQTSAERQFLTPDLTPGQRFHYVLTAEIKRNDRPVTETLQVEVVAGHETRVTFSQLIAAGRTDETRIARN